MVFDAIGCETGKAKTFHIQKSPSVQLIALGKINYPKKLEFWILNFSIANSKFDLGNPGLKI